jgi:hypothetical protein
MKTNNFFRSLALATVAILGSTAAFAQGLSLQVNFANPSCFGLSNGEVVIDISGGTEPYSVNGLQITGTQFIAGTLAEGNFTFNVSDDANNSTSADVTLVAPQALNVQGVVNNVTAFGGNDGTVDITLSNVPVVIDWSTTNGSGLVAGQVDQTTLTAGIYNLILTEGNGCQTYRRFIIGEPVNPANFFTPNFNPNTQGSTGGNTTAGN